MSLRGTPRYKHATREYHRLFKCNNEWQEMKLIEHEHSTKIIFIFSVLSPLSSWLSQLNAYTGFKISCPLSTCFVF
jgi:hypothetical protein